MFYQSTQPIALHGSLLGFGMARQFAAKSVYDATSKRPGTIECE